MSANYLNLNLLLLGRIVLLLASAILVVQAFGPHYITRAGKYCNRNFSWRKWQQQLLVSGSIMVLSLCTFIFGTIGAYIAANEKLASDPEAKTPVDWFSIVEHAGYQAIQILTFDNAPDVDNKSLLFAADCAIVMAIIIAIELLRQLFRDTLLTLWYRWPYSKRIVICGLGRIGRQVMEERGESHWLIIIEPDPENSALERARELGAIIVCGDARSQKLLRWVGAHHVEEVYFVTGNDEVNAEAILDLAESVKTRGWCKNGPVPKCYLQMSNGSLAQMIRQDDAIKSSGIQSKLVLFDAMQNAVDELVTRFLPEYRPKENQVAHFVIWGFGVMGRRMILTLAELGHFENLKRSRMTILYAPEDKQRVEEFRAEYPHFAPDLTESQNKEIDGWNFPKESDDWGSQHLRPTRRFDDPDAVEYVVNAAFIPQPPSCNDAAFNEHLAELSSNKDMYPIMIVCSGNDQDNATLAEGLHRSFHQRQIELPVFVWIPVQPRLAQLIESLTAQTADVGHRLVPFGQARDCCTIDAIDRPLRNGLAEAIYTAYELLYDENKKKSDITPLNEVTDFDTYWSNVSAASHAPFKLAVLGLEVMTVEDAEKQNRKPLSVKEVKEFENSLKLRETISAMEHHRWMAERLLRNWQHEAIPEDLDPYSDDQAMKSRWNQYRKEMTSRRARHVFIPYEQLNPNEDIKDKNQVALTLKYCSGHYTEKFSLTPLCLVRRQPQN
tara:strand:+ start:2429 stop:4600 length:2172 start_codon:yes stop_codon:yes gene_type:complete